MDDLITNVGARKNHLGSKNTLSWSKSFLFDSLFMECNNFVYNRVEAYILEI